MSNRRAERKIGTIKRSVGRLVNSEVGKWSKNIRDALFGYRRRPMEDWVAPFVQIFVVLPRIGVPQIVEYQRYEKADKVKYRLVELQFMVSERPERSLRSVSDVGKASPVKKIKEGDLLTV